MARPKNNPFAAYGLGEDALKVIERRITACKNGRSQFEGEVKELIDYYAGDQLQAPQANGDHQVVVNRILPNVELKINALTHRKPEMITTPSSSLAAARARVGKAAVKYYWRTQDYMEEARKVLQDAKICRFGVGLTTWVFETSDECLQHDRRPVEGDVPGPEQMAEAVSEGRDPMRLVPMAEVERDAPIIKRIKPTDFFFEPGAGYDLQDSRYIIWREEVPLDELKANPDYKVPKDIKARPLYDEELLSKEVRELPEEARPDDCKVVTVWHYVQRRGRLYCVYADSHWDEPLCGPKKWPWPVNDYPVDVIVAHPIPDRSPEKCVSDVDLVKTLQDATNLTRSRQVGHVEQFNSMYQCREGTMTPSARRALRKMERGGVVEHRGAQDRGLEPLLPPPLQPEVYTVEERSLRDIDYVLGSNDYTRNTVPTAGRRTATEVAAVQQTGQTRFDVDVQSFHKFLSGVSRKVLAYLKKFAYHTRSIPIYGEGDVIEEFVDLNVETIAGEYDIEVEIGSTQAVNEELEGQRAQQLLSALTPYAQMVDPMTGQPAINLVPLIRKVVQLSGIKNADTLIMPVAPPMPPAPAPGAMPAPADPAAAAAPDPMTALALSLTGAAPPA